MPSICVETLQFYLIFDMEVKVTKIKGKRSVCLLATMVITAIALESEDTLAGGLWLNEYGDFSGGRAAAGAAAGLDDAAAIFYNPAAAARLEGEHLFLSGALLAPKTRFDIDYSNPIAGLGSGGQAGLDAPGLSAAYVNDLDSEKWSAGIYLGGLAGAGLDYDSDWVGRYQATDVELLLMALSPNVSYQLTDKLSLGVGLQIYYSSLDLKLRVPSPQPGQDGKANIDGSDEGLGFTLGGLYEFSERTRAGLYYQSELDVEYDGKLKVDVVGLDVSSNTELAMAQYVRFSVHHELNQQLALAFSLGWDDWSAMDEVFVSIPGRERGLNRNWDDTYHSAIGFEYKANSEWQVTAGIAYDTNPVDAWDRTADMPIDRQVRYAFGARRQYGESMTITGYLSYADLGSARIRTENWGGEYRDNHLVQIALGFNWLL